MKFLPILWSKDGDGMNLTYVDSDIQKMQDLEQAQLDKAYELGREESRGKGKWIDKGIVEPVWDICGAKTWGHKYKCPKCGFAHTFIENHGIYNFCPICGVRVVKE